MTVGTTPSKPAGGQKIFARFEERRETVTKTHRCSSGKTLFTKLYGISDIDSALGHLADTSIQRGLQWEITFNLQYSKKTLV